MRYTTKTEYGLNCMVYLARQEGRVCVPLKEVARSNAYPLPYVEKIFQALRDAKLAVSHAGKKGGYGLARPASAITVRQVIEALEGGSFDVFCAPAVRESIVCSHFCLCGVKPIWRKTKQILDEFYQSITIEMLLKDEMGVQRSLREIDAKHA